MKQIRIHPNGVGTLKAIPGVAGGHKSRILGVITAISLIALALCLHTPVQAANKPGLSPAAAPPTLSRPPVQAVTPADPADTLSESSEQPSAKDPLDIFSGGPAGILLSQYLRTATAYTEGAARQQRRAFARMRNAKPEIQQQLVPELAAAYQRLPETDYDRRWLLIDTLGQLQTPESLDYLGQIAQTGLPDEKMPKAARHQATNDQEIAIRLAAVRGITKLARRSLPKADKLLLEVARKSPVRGVKNQAIHGYLHAPQRTTKMHSAGEYRMTPTYSQRLTVLKRTLPVEVYKPAERAYLSPRLFASPPEIIQRKQAETKKESRESSAPPTIRRGGK